MKMDMNALMKQAQALQAEMAKKQEELAGMTFEAGSGGGMVTATVNGKHELLKLAIDPTIVNKDEIDMLQDLIVAAINEGFRRATEAAQQSLSGMMGGVGGMFG